MAIIRGIQDYILSLTEKNNLRLTRIQREEWREREEDWVRIRGFALMLPKVNEGPARGLV